MVKRRADPWYNEADRAYPIRVKFAVPEKGTSALGMGTPLQEWFQANLGPKMWNWGPGALECLLSGSGPSVLLLCADADHARTVTAAMHEAGHGRAVAVPAPVSGVHVVSYDGPVG